MHNHLSHAHPIRLTSARIGKEETKKGEKVTKEFFLCVLWGGSKNAVSEFALSLNLLILQEETDSDEKRRRWATPLTV